MVDVRRRSGTRGLPWYTHKPRLRGCPRGSRGRRWRSYLSGPRREEPRSAAERLLALETKFLLFWAGQERDSVLSRSPAPRSDCSGLRERNLPVATLWPSPNERHVRWRTLPGREGRRKPQGMVRWTDGRVRQADGRHGPLDRWKGQTQRAHGMVRWCRWKGQTAHSLALAGRRALWPSPSPENLRDGLGTTRR